MYLQAVHHETRGVTTVDRDLLVEGVDQPGPDNTGVLPGTKLTVVTSMSQLVYPGINYDLDIRCAIAPPKGARPLIIRNSVIRGPVAGPKSADGLVRVFGAGHAPVELHDVTIDPQTPHRNWDGIKGYRFKVWRANISRTVDGIGVFNNNPGQQVAPIGVEVRQSWIHDLAYWPNPPDTSHSDGSHPDGIQVQGGGLVVVRGNLIEGFIGAEFAANPWGGRHANAAIMITENVGPVRVEIERNWIDGGAASINFGGKFAGHVGSVRGNRLGVGQRLGSRFAILRPAGLACDFGEDSDPNRFAWNGAVVVLKNG